MSLEKKVLLLEDEQSVSRLVSRLLQRHGYRVFVACDGLEAVRIFVEKFNQGIFFDCVILDLSPSYPGYDATQVLMKMAEVDPKVKAIVASGNSFDDVMVKFKEYGFCGKLEKPFSLEGLRQVIENLSKKNHKAP